MSFVARWMARIVWRGMLWLMRRSWMKWLQRATTQIVPVKFRALARQSQVRQNRFARRIGLPMLTFMMNLVLGSIVITLCFETAMRLYESGYLTIPRHLRRQLGV